MMVANLDLVKGSPPECWATLGYDGEEQTQACLLYSYVSPFGTTRTTLADSVPGELQELVGIHPVQGSHFRLVKDACRVLGFWPANICADKCQFELGILRGWSLGAAELGGREWKAGKSTHRVVQ
jgi:hypothetical protein